MSSATIESLVSEIVRKGIPENSKILKAMLVIDRSDFISEEFSQSAYQDIPLSIGYGQTISQPYTVAFMMELLDIRKGNKILDIGSGSGWTTALMGYITSDKGSVLGIEIIPELVSLGRRNLSKYHMQNTEIIRADENLGVPGRKFDRILVSASGEHIYPELLQQLDMRGVLVMPIRNSIWKIKKLRGDMYEEAEYPGFVFVPLITWHMQPLMPI